MTTTSDSAQSPPGDGTEGSTAADYPQPEQIEEMLLGSELRYTRGESIARGGVSAELADRLWRAFGYPQLPDDAVAFTDGDVEALRQIRELLRTGFFDEEFAVRMARAAGQTLARLAEWQTDIIVGAVTGPVTTPAPETVRVIAEVIERYLADLEPLMIYAWRRQLAASATRALTTAEDQDPAHDAGRDELVSPRGRAGVGFADMVSFTQLSREVDEAELAGIVERFEATAADAIAAEGGRLVKTLGDEVLFSAETPRRTAEIALRLAAAGAGDADLPAVRVGVAYGPVLPVMGDVFGTTVNLAARLTSFARPGAVLVDAALAAALKGDEAYELFRIVRRPARGLGIVQPYVLRPAVR